MLAFLTSSLTRYIKLTFHNVQDLLSVRSELMPIVNRNREQLKNSISLPLSLLLFLAHEEQSNDTYYPSTSYLYDIREYDVPYVARVCIDNNIRIGSWFEVSCENEHLHVSSTILILYTHSVIAWRT